MARKSGPRSCVNSEMEWRIFKGKMTNDETMTKHEARRGHARANIRASSFGFPSSFVIRASSLSSCSAHTRYFRQRQHMPDDRLTRYRLDLLNSDRLSDIEATGFQPPQGFQVRATTESLADIVCISANIKTFAAEHAEIDLRKGNSVDRITIHVHKPRLAFDGFPLSRQLVERHAAMFYGGNHRRHLVEVAPEFVECVPHLLLAEQRN